MKSTNEEIGRMVLHYLKKNDQIILRENYIDMMVDGWKLEIQEETEEKR